MVFQFFAEAGYLHIDRTFSDDILVTTDSIDYLVTGKYPTAVARQKKQDAKFTLGEFYRFILYR